jgi:cytochrome c-type biogenesis protein CcmH/NrfF
LLFYALGTASLLLGVFLAGVSLLLWTALPEVNAHSAWLMWFVPLALGLFALACWARAKRIKVARPFGKLKAQFALDILALRQNKEP